MRNYDPLSLDVHNTSFHVPVMQVYVGINATDTIFNSPIGKDTEGVKKYKISCNVFLIELVDQIRSRFETIKSLSFLVPENALNLRLSSLRGIPIFSLRERNL